MKLTVVVTIKDIFSCHCSFIFNLIYSILMEKYSHIDSWKFLSIQKRYIFSVILSEKEQFILKLIHQGMTPWIRPCVRNFIFTHGEIPILQFLIHAPCTSRSKSLVIPPPAPSRCWVHAFYLSICQRFNVICFASSARETKVISRIYIVKGKLFLRYYLYRIFWKLEVICFLELFLIYVSA